MTDHIEDLAQSKHKQMLNVIEMYYAKYKGRHVVKDYYTRSEMNLSEGKRSPGRSKIRWSIHYLEKPVWEVSRVFAYCILPTAHADISH